MGKFAVMIRTHGDWPDAWTVQDVEKQWHVYVNTQIEQAAAALQGAPPESKEFATYTDAIVRVSGDDSGKKGMISKAIDWLALKDRAPVNRKAMMESMLDALDDVMDLIENHGNLYLRRLEHRSIFAGESCAKNNAVPAQHAQPCNVYDFKHFGQDKKAARYLGRFDRQLRLVKALEEMALEAGLAVPGSNIFRFDENIGWDGIGAMKINTACIRVDSIGAGQHSHPLPESGEGYVSHQSLVKKAVVDAVEEKDLERLLDIAKYLTVIGATIREYTLTGALRTRVNAAAKGDAGFALPACKFWD